MNDLQYIVRKTTDEEFKAKMPYLTSSMAEAVNTCPRWGIVHSVLGKRFVTGYRQMALEAGSLMHDVFMCLNLMQVGVVQGFSNHMHFQGNLLFGNQRWEFIWEAGNGPADTDLTIEDVNRFERILFAVIGTSEFFDDPDDRNRTLSNLEHCSLELLQYWFMNLQHLPIYIEDRSNPRCRVGIEISLDCVFEITMPTGKLHKIRCIGLADAVYQNVETLAISLGEYKTAASMNDAWRLAFDTRHQITLYNALLQAYFGVQDTFNTILTGSSIPVKKTSLPVQHFTVARDQENIQQLLNTFIFTESLVDKYTSIPLATPMFTHSCNRYFRPCSLLDLCTAAKEDQEMMMINMPTVDAPSPSEQKALMRNM
jgi:hypothetical protein